MAPDIHVAIVACRTSRDAASHDLYPDDDWQLVAASLGRAGLHGQRVAWDDPEVVWEQFDTAVLRSTWDSVDRPQEFLAWARSTAQVTRLVNPLPAIEWGLDKRYLLALEASGIPIVPTRWFTETDAWEAPSTEFVVKPAISGGSRETARYRPYEGARAGEHIARLVARGDTVMVQPYIAEVEAPGELKVVFIDGAFSHAVRVGPTLPSDAVILARPWERPVEMRATTPSREERRVGERAIDVAQRVSGASLAYARVDLVGGLVGEVEVIDPSLLLRFAPDAADRLVHALSD